MRLTPKHLVRALTLLVGGTILLLGIAMIVLPGPALVLIPLGVVILAGEFAWARRLRRRVQELAESLENDGDDPLPRGRDDTPG